MAGAAGPPSVPVGEIMFYGFTRHMGRFYTPLFLVDTKCRIGQLTISSLGVAYKPVVHTLRVGTVECARFAADPDI